MLFAVRVCLIPVIVLLPTACMDMCTDFSSFPAPCAARSGHCFARKPIGGVVTFPLGNRACRKPLGRRPRRRRPRRRIPRRRRPRRRRARHRASLAPFAGPMPAAFETLPMPRVWPHHVQVTRIVFFARCDGPRGLSMRGGAMCAACMCRAPTVAAGWCRRVAGTSPAARSSVRAHCACTHGASAARSSRLGTVYCTVIIMCARESVSVCSDPSRRSAPM